MHPRLQSCSRARLKCCKRGVRQQSVHMTRQKEARKTKDGMCRRITARLDAHHRRGYERRNHDTPREACCSSSAYPLKGGGFQDANSYRVSIVAKSPRGCAGILRGGEKRWRWRMELATICYDATGRRVTTNRFKLRCCPPASTLHLPAPFRGNFATIHLGKRFAF